MSDGARETSLDTIQRELTAFARRAAAVDEPAQRPTRTFAVAVREVMPFRPTPIVVASAIRRDC